MAFLYSEGVFYAEYQIAATTSASTAIPIVFENDWSLGRVVLEAEGTDIAFLFSNISGGSASIAPDSTTKKLPANNFSVTNGAILSCNIQKPAQDAGAISNTVWCSVITTTGTGTAKIKLVRI